MMKKFRGLSATRGKLCARVRSESQSTAELLEAFRADPAVEHVEPNFIRRFGATTPTTNDPYLGSLWALENTGQVVNGSAGTAGADIGWVAARPLLRPSSDEMVIAIVDTGIDFTHPDLADNLWTNEGEIPDNGIDDDANGYVDDIHGYRFAGVDDNQIADSGEHGTHIAGTIAALANNAAGVSGVMPDVKLMILRVSDNGQDFSSSGEIDAFEYVIEMKRRGVNVVAINGSYGGGGFSSIESDIIDEAGDEGIIFCAASGNDGADNDVTPFYPANLRRPSMIVVASTDQDDGISSFSNYGNSSVDLAAPGRNILSTRPSWDVATSASVAINGVDYAAAGLIYAGYSEGVTHTVHHCGLGYPEDFPAEVAGNIALIQRGTLFFSEKLTHAMDAGAVAAIIYNNVEGAFNYWHLQQPSGWVPAVGISKEDGEALVDDLPFSATVINSPNPSQWYRYLFGTSMATPHVTAAVAFAARNHPGETSVQRVARILAGVSPAPELAGKTVTGGRLDLHRLADSTGNGLPDWWEDEFFGGSEADPTADPDADGQSNFDEFVAGTDPLSSISRLVAASAGVTGGGWFELALPSVTGRSYQLESSASMADGTWTLHEPSVRGTGGLLTLDDSAQPSGGERRFYRVRVALEP